MAETAVVFKRAGMKQLMEKWAKGDGKRRGEQVAAAMTAAGVRNVRVMIDEHPQRFSVHVGSHDEKAMFREAATGRMARSLGAAR